MVNARMVPRCHLSSSRSIVFVSLAVLLLVSWIGDDRSSLVDAAGSTGKCAILTNTMSRKETTTTKSRVLSDIRASLLSSDVSDMPSDLDGACDDHTRAWKFLRGLAGSSTFVREYWHRRPLVVRGPGDTGGWVAGAFTVERDLRLVGGSYISGHRTADVLRNGTETDTWKFVPLKSDPARRTTWEEVRTALEGGTVYFNTAGGLWPTLGSLCLLSNRAFGLPSNVNVYVTPPKTTLSVPPHTDRQDVLVLQTAGSKRWRVYSPPQRKKGVDPLDRGKAGDVLSFEELELTNNNNNGPNQPLLDVLLRPGDVLYIPAGFPHTTDTSTLNVADHDDDDNNDREDVFNETSVHLTMGLDTHVWGLTYAHLRWSLLQRSGKNFNLNIESDDMYWDAMETIPVGFLKTAFKQGIMETNHADIAAQDANAPDFFIDKVCDELKNIMVRLEPRRWKLDDDDDNDNDHGTNDDAADKEDLPTLPEFREVVSYMIDSHLVPLFEIQDEMFRNVDPHDEETIIKAYHGGQRQNKVMENFGKFSKNRAMEESFKQMRERRSSQLQGGGSGGGK